MIAFRVPPLTIEIADGDLAAEQTDAVVNAANNLFWMGAGVAGALKARGGPSIEAEAMAQGPVEPGECVITSGGHLAARFVIHAAVMGQDLRTSAAIIERATRSSLDLAESHHITSIAFPAFGTGVGGFPIDRCAHLMIATIRAHASRARSLRLVRLVLFGSPAYRVAADVAGGLLGAPLDGPPDCPVSG
ncbi:MAG TPA: macro domain-containing protein [Gemmatimonadaceae bacterium]|jgi:O-acetyl-ADP-ribose deacetylase (regulator of RNase III)|nr:macro domain-containing protein [Gemmatimonadaceae bacterium]